MHNVVSFLYYTAGSCIFNDDLDTILYVPLLIVYSVGSGVISSKLCNFGNFKLRWRLHQSQNRMPPKTPISDEKKAKATAYAAAMAAEGPALMELMGSVPGPQKHKKRSVSFASQAEVQTLTPEAGHQVLTSAPISTPKHESQSAKPDPKPDPKPHPSQPSDQPVAAEAIPDPEAEVMVDNAEDEGISQTPPNLDEPDLGEFTSQTSSSPELPTPSTPLTLTPTSSQQTSQPSQSSKASSGPSSIGDIDLSQDWDEVKRQIHKCTEKMELRDCIQKLETWVASLGDSPFRKKVQEFFPPGGQRAGRAHPDSNLFPLLAKQGRS